MSNRIIGRWRSLPVVPAERLEGARIFEALSDPNRMLALRDRELAIYSDNVTHSRLHLLEVKSVAPWLLSMDFCHWGRPWLPPITFYCQRNVQKVTEELRSKIAEALIVGYPEFPVIWELVTEPVAAVG